MCQTNGHKQPTNSVPVWQPTANCIGSFFAQTYFFTRGQQEHFKQSSSSSICSYVMQ